MPNVIFFNPFSICSVNHAICNCKVFSYCSGVNCYSVKQVDFGLESQFSNGACSTTLIPGCTDEIACNYNIDANVDYCRELDELNNQVDQSLNNACRGEDDCVGNATCDGSCFYKSGFDILVDGESSFGIGDNIVKISISGNDRRLSFNQTEKNYNYGGTLCSKQH